MSCSNSEKDSIMLFMSLSVGDVSILFMKNCGMIRKGIFAICAVVMVAKTVVYIVEVVKKVAELMMKYMNCGLGTKPASDTHSINKNSFFVIESDSRKGSSAIFLSA